MNAVPSTPTSAAPPWLSKVQMVMSAIPIPPLPPRIGQHDPSARTVGQRAPAACPALTCPVRGSSPPLLGQQPGRSHHDLGGLALSLLARGLGRDVVCFLRDGGRGHGSAGPEPHSFGATWSLPPVACALHGDSQASLGLSGCCLLGPTAHSEARSHGHAGFAGTGGPSLSDRQGRRAERVLPAVTSRVSLSPL